MFNHTVFNWEIYSYIFYTFLKFIWLAKQAKKNRAYFKETYIDGSNVHKFVLL